MLVARGKGTGLKFRMLATGTVPTWQQKIFSNWCMVRVKWPRQFRGFRKWLKLLVFKSVSFQQSTNRKSNIANWVAMWPLL